MVGSLSLKAYPAAFHESKDRTLPAGFPLGGLADLRLFLTGSQVFVPSYDDVEFRASLLEPQAFWIMAQALRYSS